MASLFLPLLLFIGLSSASKQARSPQDHLRLDDASFPYAGTVEVPLDHFNPLDNRTFLNRYWMNDTYYKPGGPIFMYDNGEAGVQTGQPAQSLSEEGIVFGAMELAKKYHGIGILWEHRYFGGSMPFETDNVTGVALAGYDAYQYLTNEQALEDVVYFAKNFQPPGYKDSSLSSDSTPWIWIGGSYAGYRAAMIRVRNPDVFFASWSSSGPVETVVQNSVYFNQIWQHMPTNCTADVNAAITYADTILSHGSQEEIALLKKAAFLTNSVNPRNPIHPSPSSMNEWDVASVLAYPFQASFFSFQSFGYEIALSTFCTQLSTYNPSNSTPFTISSPLSVLSNNSDSLPPTSAGVAATYGSKAAFYAFIYATIQKSEFDWSSFPILNLFTPADAASWKWMLCNQIAQFQVSQFPSSTNLISRFYNISGTEAFFCHELLPYTPKFPNIESMKVYGGLDMQPSNVMFTAGEVDPWRALGVQSFGGINPEAPDRITRSTIPKCNEPPPGDEIFGVVYEGGTHASDLSRRAGNITGNLDVGLELFGSTLDVWLPCFKPKR
jgi:hypothetical protein